MDNFYSTPSLAIRDFQNLDIKNLFLFEIISAGILYRAVIVLWKRDANSLAFITFLYSMKCVVFLFLLIVINILSNSWFDPNIFKMGNLMMKSIDIDD